MTANRTPLATAVASISFPAAPVLMAFAILVLDAATDVVVDVGVLYIAVILLSAQSYQERGIVFVSLGCAVLSLMGFLLSPGDHFSVSAIANRFLGLAAMGSATFLSVRDQLAQIALQQTQ